MSLAEKLAKKWPSMADAAETISSAVDKYDLAITFDCYKSDRLQFLDQGSRTVEIIEGRQYGEMLVSDVAPVSDVIVIGMSGILLGWFQGKANLEEAGVAIRANSLVRMPERFDFPIPCAHLSIHGGVWDNEHDGWLCFGCGNVIRNDINIG